MGGRNSALLVASAVFAAWAVPPPRLEAGGGYEAAAADSVASEVLASHPAAGLAIGVARGGRTLFARGYGLADVESRVPVSADTVFPICSISKNFAAAAVLKLAEQGRVDRTALAAKYLTGVSGLAPGVTVDSLLNHSSGLGSYNEGDDWDALAPRAMPHAEMIARIASRPHEPPGRDWGYSNSAFYLAGLLVERVSGTDYWTFLSRTFFRPLGMRHAGPCAEISPVARARGYRVEKDRLTGAETENWRNPFAGGGLCMTAGELLSWEAALDGGRALSADSVRAMRTPTRLTDGRRYDYGLGTRMGSLEGHPVVGHTGGGQGFSTVLLRFPDDDLTVVVFKNFAGSPGAATIGARLARRLLGLPAFAPRGGAPPPALLASVSGDWMGDDGPFRLASRDGRLAVELPNGATLEAPWMGGTTFAAGEDEIARFEIVNGRSARASQYGGGLFVSVIVRATPAPTHISNH
jgi:CubicO group peptidase (beta-lactamase class C family)